LPETDLGPCCLCEAPEATVIWFIEKRGQTRGWGCLQCKLLFYGATAVICEECEGRILQTPAFTWRDLKHYCGFPATERRPIAELFDTADWLHDLTRHPEISHA